jgi:hypothetical protein
VYEKPIHPFEFVRLTDCRVRTTLIQAPLFNVARGNLNDWNDEYPYARGSQVGRYDGDDHRALIDSQLDPELRVSLLISILEAAKYEAWHKRKELKDLKVRVLVRKPTTSPSTTGDPTPVARSSH